MIKLYLDKILSLRKIAVYSFFIGCVAPFRPVPPKTVACWVLEALGKAGINIKTFKAHAIRSTSTSAAYSKIRSFAVRYSKNCWL